MAIIETCDRMSRQQRVRRDPVAAGFRPSTAVLALAAAFGLQATPAGAQPSGGVAIHGSASFATSGNRFTVTTRNGPGTNHSALNWQSFSVPAGTTTEFVQPGAGSTSINRVVANNPSSIFGTLHSNGRLVLVNPAGITVGTGAVVDTAGFTASTLAMSEADAVAGLLRFGGNGAPLKVEGGAVVRAQGGDVVLIAPQVHTAADALVQSDGATLLLAGRKVEITGRGLEGIRMEVQAGSEAVNLGTLQGDAVGIFAGTLRHSGLVQAQSASVQGGKVVLKAADDAVVAGAVTARAGARGGAIDVLAQHVALQVGATLDASGPAGGGQVRIGGDYQGGNAQVPNATRTEVDAQALVRADATQQGDGGRVIVWADEATAMQGRISARGGPQGGNGGFAEVSGKRSLAFGGSADLRAPQGKAGTLLLDPDDFCIGEVCGPALPALLTHLLNEQLERSDVHISVGLSDVIGGRITVVPGVPISWTSGNRLTLEARNTISLAGDITAVSPAGVTNGGLHLSSLTGDVVQLPGSVVRVDQVLLQAGGKVDLAGANRVNTLAGSAGTGFTFSNAQSLTIGPVFDCFCSGIGTGLDGPVQLTTTAGDLLVRSQVSGSGVTLQAAGNVDIQDAQVFSGAAVHVTAGGDALFGPGTSFNTFRGPIDVTAGGSIAGSASFSTNGSAAGTVTLTATEGGISFSSIQSSGSFSAGRGGDVTLQAKGSIVGGSIQANGSAQTALRSGRGGDVHVSSSAGNIDIGFINADGGFGFEAAGGNGGAIVLAAPSTAAGAGRVQVRSSLSADGGSAQSLAGTGGFAGGAGGSVSVTAGNDIVIGSHEVEFDSAGFVRAAGGFGTSPSLGAGEGGAGGAVTLTSLAGGIELVSAGSSIAVHGGGGTRGGDGGTILLQAAKDVSVGALLASGGPESGEGLAPGGGAGGGIGVSAGGDITLGSFAIAEGAGSGFGAAGHGGTISFASSAGAIHAGDAFISVDGGSGVTAGAGGSAVFTAAGDIALANVQARGGSSSGAPGGLGGSVHATSAAGNIDIGFAMVDGGNAGADDAGAGGSVVLSALSTAAGTGGIHVGFGLSAFGGNADTGIAGQGGSLTLDAGRDIRIGTGGEAPVSGFLQANGGFSLSDSLAGGSAGAGGTISLTSHVGDIFAGHGFSQITARGGSGGAGGQGGSVSLEAVQGSVTLGAVDVAGGEGLAAGSDASGGDGGALTVIAGQQIRLGAVPVFAHGGHSAAAAGGAGGSVSFTAGGNVEADAAGIFAQGGSGAAGGRGGSVAITSMEGDVAIGVAQVTGGEGFLAPGGAGGSIALTALGTGAEAGNIHVGFFLGAQGGTGSSTSGAGSGGQGGTIALHARHDIMLGSGDTEFGDGFLDASGGSASFADGPLANGGGGGTITLASEAGDILFAGPGGAAQANGGGGATAGAGGTIAVRTGGTFSAAALHARGGEGAPAGETTAAGSGGAGGTVDIHFTGAQGVLDAVSFIDVTGGSGGSSGTTPGAGAGGTGGTITIRGDQALRVGGEVAPVLAAQGGFGGFDGDTASASGAAGSIVITAASTTLDSVVLDGNAQVFATAGALSTRAGSVQSAVAGNGLALDASDGITLAGQIQAFGLDGAGVSLHAARGDITQAAGGIATNALVARADAGSVRLTQSNAAFVVAGVAAGVGSTFEYASGLDSFTVGSVATPFAAATGITATSGVNVRALGDLQVQAAIHTTGGAVLLQAGDDSIAPAPVFGFHGFGNGTLQVSGGIATQGGDIALRAGRHTAYGAESVLEVSGAVDAGAGAITLVRAGQGQTALGEADLSGASVSITDAAHVRMTDSSIVASSGDVRVLAGQGTGSTNGEAVDITASRLQAGGAILVAGRSADANSFGVVLRDDVRLAAGSGTQVLGEQTAGGGFGGGVLVTGTDCVRCLDGTGALTLAGMSAGFGPGVLLDGATLRRGGALTLTGTSAGNTGVGVHQSHIATGGGDFTALSPQTVSFEASVVETAGGNLTLAGGSLVHQDVGVAVVDGSSLHAQGGDVDIRGASASGPGFLLESSFGGLTVSGRDVVIVGSTVLDGPALLIDAETVTSTNSMQLTALGGSLQIQGGSTVSNSGPGAIVMRSEGPNSFVSVSADSSVTSSGDIVVTADRIALEGTLHSATGRTLIRPLDLARRITINGSDEAGTLNFTQAELDRMTGGLVVIGDLALTGGISVEAPTAIANGASLSLRTGGAVTQQAGALLTARNLAVDADSVVLREVSIGDGTGGVLAGRARGGAFVVLNQQAVPAPLQIGSVDGMDGITAVGPVAVTTPGLLRLSQAVHSDAAGNAIGLAAADLLRDGAGALASPDGRWLVYLPGPSANLATGPVSGNLALWGRGPASNPPDSIADGGNRYLFAATPVVDVAAEGRGKVYDGSSAFGPLTFVATGLVNAADFGNVFLQDTFTGALAVPAATKNVGTYAITQGTLLAPAGYALGRFTPGTATITPAPLVLAGVTADDKVYDGTTAATLSGAPSLLGTVAGDAVAVASVAAAFGDRNAGAGKPVSLLRVDLSGADAGNYALSLPLLAASITPATLSVAGLAAADKVYDGSTAATLTGSGALQGVLGGDGVSLVAGAARFGDPNAGTGKPVAVSGFSLSGPEAGNYRLAPPPSLVAAITPAPLTITANDLAKDEGVALAFAGTEFTAQGLVGTERIAAVTLASPGAPAAATGGTYAITASGGTGTNGFVAGNYRIAYVDGTLSVARTTLAPATVQVNNQVVSFASQFDTEAKTQPSITPSDDKRKKEEKKDDIVVTDSACKR
ncbi:YDG domain-containing protein [Ramlibacter sp. AN1133]|uniref:YDG domain-containing protein n=1 Tax=Ramlibacter sp. AN1133 TaxID=3133429 RepID=UPI0030C364A2